MLDAMLTIRPFALLLASAAILSHTPANAAETIHVVGSSTVFPFATAAAEEFGRSSGFRTPIVEATGTGAGIKIFCAGNNPNTPDIANASRPIKASELQDCKKNGVNNVVELTIGFDGIVIGNAVGAPAYALTIKDLYLALAKEVPVNGKLVANPYKTWQQVNPALPNEPVQVYGPPPTSGTRDAFLELVMDKACEAFPEIRSLPEDQRKGKCQSLREDGAYIQVGENDNLIIQRLQSNPHSLGIFGYSFFEENSDVIKGATINGVEPTFEDIADGKYPVSRSLFIYVKKDHIGLTPGLHEFLKAFTSEEAMGEDGYLADKGLIPLLPELQKSQQQKAASLETLPMPK